MPVLTGDSWPLSGWRAVMDEEAEVAEDGTEAESMVEFVLVVEPVWRMVSNQGGDCGRIMRWCCSSRSNPPKWESDHDKMRS